MTDEARAVAAAGRRARRAANEAVASPWTERLARAGYATKGLIYLMVGVLALQVALGAGGQITDSRGALLTIIAQPFGMALLGLVTAGLAGYALWRLVQALFDVERKGADAKGMATRASYAVNGLAYGGLAVAALRLLSDMGGPAGGDATGDWTARLLGQPFGPWLVGAAGVGVIGLGFYHLHYGLTAGFRSHFAAGVMGEPAWRAAMAAGRVGYTARAAVFVLVGAFLILAGWTSDAGQARGLGGVLESLLQQPFGRWLLGGVAGGLAAYGLYNGFEARYHRINPRPPAS